MLHNSVVFFLKQSPHFFYLATFRLPKSVIRQVKCKLHQAICCIRFLTFKTIKTFKILMVLTSFILKWPGKNASVVKSVSNIEFHLSIFLNS